jgi:cyclopropane-fatty-acyl-phospholipid synthase
LGPADAPATLLVHSPVVFRRLITAPGELGMGRAYVAGELDVEGDLYSALAALADRMPDVRAFGPRQWAEVLRLAGSSVLRTGFAALPVPPEEAHLSGVRHSKERDAAAIAHHYDVSNDFYRIVLGPSMTYSCAVWPSPDAGLEAAQAAKYELISQKLALRPGMRLLDVGCGPGSITAGLARRVAPGEAIGIDASQSVIETARSLRDPSIGIEPHYSENATIDSIGVRLTSDGVLKMVGVRSTVEETVESDLFTVDGEITSDISVTI